MNLHILDNDLDKIAEYYADQHIWNSLNEIPIMLALAYTRDELLSSLILNLPPNIKSDIIKNNSCCKWIRENKENFLWTINLWKKLNLQAILRFHISNHRYNNFICWIEQNLPKFEEGKFNFFKGIFTSFSQARKCKDQGGYDIVELYRMSYRENKHRLRWSNQKPEWL